MARAIRMVLGWRLRGRTWPHPFFARETGAPIYPVTVLSQPQREALRPLCGPQSDGGETWSGMSRDLFGLPQQNALNLHRTALRNLARGRQATQTRRRLDAAMQDQPPDRLLARIAEIGHAPAHSASRRHRAVPGYGGPTDRGKFSTRPALYRHGKRTSRCGSAMP